VLGQRGFVRPAEALEEPSVLEGSQSGPVVIAERLPLRCERTHRGDLAAVRGQPRNTGADRPCVARRARERVALGVQPIALDRTAQNVEQETRQAQEPKRWN